MGNPVRYAFAGKYSCRRPEEVDGKLVIGFINNCPEETQFEEVFIDVYSAPDVIYTYLDGDTCKNEFMKFNKTIYKNLVELQRTEQVEEYYKIITIEYSFGEYRWEEYKGLDMQRNVIFGKFIGMTDSQLEKYNEKVSEFWRKTFKWTQAKKPE